MKNKLLTFSVVTFTLLWIAGCVELLDTQSENENIPPNTTLANIPVENDTLFALIKLSWDGEDNDGFVVAYDYRYTTYPLFGTDSIHHDWIRTEASGLTIAFSSPDSLNRQEFKVRAVDNSGNVDPTPASRTLFTIQTIPPKTEILGPRDGEEFFAVPQVSVWFPGITVRFSGDDKDGSVVAYAWSVDGGEFHWVDAKDTVVVIKPNDFAEPLDGEHTIKVISKDDTELIDPVGDDISIDLVVPSFERDILILDDTREQGDLALRNVPDDTVDAFYEDIFGWNNNYDIDERNMLTRGFPSKRILGRYRLAIWHSDDGKNSFFTNNESAIQSIISYLNVGGDLIIGGKGIIDPWYPPADPITGLGHPIIMEQNSFSTEYLHLIETELSGLEGNFTGATGVARGFPDIEIDPSKINPNFPHNGLGNLVVTAVLKGGFTRDLMVYQGSDPFNQGLPCAIRYFGDVYDLAFIGFPLYMIKKDDARVFASALLKNMGY